MEVSLKYYVMHLLEDKWVLQGKEIPSKTRGLENFIEVVWSKGHEVPIAENLNFMSAGLSIIECVIQWNCAYMRSIQPKSKHV